MVKLIRWIRGYVLFEVKGRFPERFLNLCARYGISLFNPVPSGRTFTASMLMCDYKRIRTIARKSAVTLRVKKRCGLPFVLARYRSRFGIFAGAVAFVAIIIVMQSFVWTIEINGLSTVSVARFTDILKTNGLESGALKNGLDLQAIQRKVMQDVDEIGWMSINIIGTKAEVEVKEKDTKPAIRDTSTPCNIKADTDGIIVSMDILSGKAVIPVGSAVKKGQLLVSAVVENSLQNIKFVHSDAKVMAKTMKTAVFQADFSGEYKAPVRMVSRRRISLFWFDVPISVACVNGVYTTRVITEKIVLNDTCVPCEVKTQYCTEYANIPFVRNKATTEKVTSADEALFRFFALSECETIDAVQKVTVSEKGYRAEVEYACTEDIGYKENLVVNQ